MNDNRSIDELTDIATKAFSAAHRRWFVSGPYDGGFCRLIEYDPLPPVPSMEQESLTTKSMRMIDCANADMAQKLKFRMCIEAAVKAVIGDR